MNKTRDFDAICDELRRRQMFEFVVDQCDEHFIDLVDALGYSRKDEVVAFRHELWKAMIERFHLEPPTLAGILKSLPTTIADGLKRHEAIQKRRAEQAFAPTRMLPGAGPRLDCALDDDCTRELLRVHFDAEACHCPPSCAHRLPMTTNVLIQLHTRRKDTE